MGELLELRPFDKAWMGNQNKSRWNKMPLDERLKETDGSSFEDRQVDLTARSPHNMLMKTLELAPKWIPHQSEYLARGRRVQNDEGFIPMDNRTRNKYFSEEFGRLKNLTNFQQSLKQSPKEKNRRFLTNTRRIRAHMNQPGIQWQRLTRFSGQSDELELVSENERRISSIVRVSKIISKNYDSHYNYRLNLGSLQIAKSRKGTNEFSQKVKKCG
jgi:hypothetical protein